MPAAANLATNNKALRNFDPTDLARLRNPIWHSLNTEHAHLALSYGPARRYPADIGPLGGIPDTSAASYEALRSLASPDNPVALFLEEPPNPPANLELVRTGGMHQMIYLPHSAPDRGSSDIVELGAADHDEMVALATLTRPGPFERRTMTLGTFFGIRHSGQLVAMAGMRLHLPQFTEVSAVCTHPDARGRGYGQALTAHVAAHILAGGKTPFLHLLRSNTSALRVYQSLGFTLLRDLEFALLRPAA